MAPIARIDLRDGGRISGAFLARPSSAGFGTVSGFIGPNHNHRYRSLHKRVFHTQKLLVKNYLKARPKMVVPATPAAGCGSSTLAIAGASSRRIVRVWNPAGCDGKLD
jgi:hypothetical protein